MVYMTIYWTSDDCHGQAILTLPLVRRTSDIISLFRSLDIPDVMNNNNHYPVDNSRFNVDHTLVGEFTSVSY